MKTNCIAPEDLERVRELPPEHADVKHVRSCARCSSLMREYEDFVREPTAVPEGADLEHAHEVLGRRLRDTIVAGAESTPRRHGRILSLHPGLAAAAVLVIVVGVSLWMLRPTTPSMVLRGGSDVAESLLLEEPVMEGDTWVLRWSAVPDADAYRVQVFTADLQEIAHVDVASPPLTLSPSDLPVHTPPLHWRVTALVAGDPHLRSSVKVLPEAGR